MTSSTNPPLNSGTTGPVSLASAASNAIGQLRSGMPSESGSPAGALAKLTPQETNARMEVALERISGRRPSFGRRMMFPENGPAYSICERATWRCDNDQQRAAALEAVEFSLRPAPEDDIAAALYTLRVMTRGRDAAAGDDRQAEAIIWLQHLRAYPADIVLITLRNWPKRSDGQWWPTWHDVQKTLDALTGHRRLLAEHIRSGACLAKPGTAVDDRDDSPEGVAHRQAVVARHMAKLSQREEAERSKPRTPEDVAHDIEAAGMPKLSDEALRLYASKAVPSPDEQFEAWDRDQSSKERAA